MEEKYQGFPTFYAKDSHAWRDWLAENHDQAASVWLIIFKKASRTPSITYDQAVDDALCYGWIDSKPNKRDAESYYQYFSPRNPKSNWSSVNKEKVKRLQQQGLMQAPGLEMVHIAQSSGTWTALEAVDKLVIPDDLAAAFAQTPLARQHFDAFPPSTKRGILEWIFNAKRPATRTKRIQETVAKAAQNIRANQYRK